MVDPNLSRFSTRILTVWILLGWSLGVQHADTKNQTFSIPKVWDDVALADWVTPVAGLNVRPTHMSEREYYSMPESILRSYPVYMPGREPEGYWEKLQHMDPEPLIRPETLKTEEDWIAAGRLVFDQASLPQMITDDPRVISEMRSREFLEQQRVKPAADGTIPGFRWMPTKGGVRLSKGGSCVGCHSLTRDDGLRVPGASARAEISRARPFPTGGLRADYLESANHLVRGASPFFMDGETLGTQLYQAWGVPWLKDDPNQRLRNLKMDDYEAYVTAERMGGAITRWNGSIYFPAKIPDLIGVKDRKYFDHTATHLHRGIGDLMRYAAQVSFAEVADFGPYHVLLPGTKRVRERWPDAALYALALYIYSLQPPPNPNPYNEKAEAGHKLFEREGCPICHTPPLYTNNKLTLAQGFTLPSDKPDTLDVLRISVGTEVGLALKTRKGTGYYKVPSLKGVWYRGHYLHDGSAASLEEMFDPDRLEATHVPGGWLPPGQKTRAIKGHEFGLKLKPTEREQLIAFLRTL